MIRPRAKIFYPAGSISIILLPFFCIWYLNLRGHFEKIGAIDVGYFYHSKPGEYSSKKFFEKIKLARNYNEIEFTGNEINDRMILKYAGIKVATIVNSKDTINGITFRFTNKAKYRDFVGAIDITQHKETNSVIDGNNIWIFYTKPTELKPSEYFFVCGTNDSSRKVEMNAEKTEAFDQYLNEKVKSLILPSILFFLMCFFSLKK